MLYHCPLLRLKSGAFVGEHQTGVVWYTGKEAAYKRGVLSFMLFSDFCNQAADMRLVTPCTVATAPSRAAPSPSSPKSARLIHEPRG